MKHRTIGFKIEESFGNPLPKFSEPIICLGLSVSFPYRIYFGSPSKSGNLVFSAAFNALKFLI